MEVFVDSLMKLNAEVGPKETKIESEQFGSLQVNYNIEHIGSGLLNLGVIVNGNDYFILRSKINSSSSYMLVKILETAHVLEIDSPQLDEKFEIQHCQLSLDESLGQSDDWREIFCNDDNVSERFSIIPTGVLHPWLSHRAEFYSNGDTTELWSFSLIQNEGDLNFKVWLYVAEANVHVKWDGMTSDGDRTALTLNMEFTGDSFESIAVETDHTVQAQNPRFLSEVKIHQGGYVYFYEKLSVNHEKDFYTTIEASTQFADGEEMTSSLDVRETESENSLPKFTYTLSNNNFYQPWILEHVIGGDTILVHLDTQLTSEFGFNGDLDCNLANDKKCVMKTWSRDSREDPIFNSRLEIVLQTSTDRLFFHIQDLENESEPFDWFKADIAAENGDLKTINMKSLMMKYKNYHSELFLSADFSEITEIDIFVTGDEEIGKVFYFRGNSRKFEMQALPILNTFFMDEILDLMELFELTDFNIKMVQVQQVPLFEIYGDNSITKFTMHRPEEFPYGIESLAGQNFTFFSLESASEKLDSAIGIDLTEFSKGSYNFYAKYHQDGMNIDFEQSYELGLVKASLLLDDPDEGDPDLHADFQLRYGQDDEGVTKGTFQNISLCRFP